MVKIMNEFKQFIKIFIKIIYIVLFIFIILLGSFIIFYYITIDKYEKSADYKPPITLYTIVSPSMEPNIKVFDVIVDKRIDDINNLNKNDVITFVSTSPKSDGLIITHRIIAKNTYNGETYLITKGDNNFMSDDAYVYENQILGKVMFKIPGLAKVHGFLAYQGGWLFIIVIPCLGVIIYDIVKIGRKKIKKLKKKRRIM